jgi:histidinol phosphatase-like enzyme
MVRQREGADQQDAPGGDAPGAQDHRGTTYVFDLDGTLCQTTGRNYAAAAPIPERIALVNRLYHAGARILIDSARGSGTGRDWQQATVEQLRGWGVKFHEVRTGVKLPGDFYIDDKAVTDREFFHAKR